ncbi:MAG TPA: diguanylate cyclase [Coxiellaceae bacterium]|nr:MAG: hypothetical protein A3E81_07075 [Gammaproteobacteria bacterium RIFCSPHIGHO2_12_FULL_36_30]HLB56412.1 diguanylate cyclase [Coxiellaceae bacterium]
MISTSAFNRLITITRIFFGIFVTVLGGIVLFGWYTDNITLIQVRPYLTPMQFNTALGILLSGLSMLCLKNYRKIAIFFSVIIFLLTALTLLQYIFYINIGIDQLFVKSIFTTNTSHPGRMAPNTAMCLLAISIMFLTNQFSAHYKWNSLIALILCVIVGIMGLTSLTGYFLHVSVLYNWGNYTAMALHTASGLLAIAIGSFLFMLNQSWQDHAERNYCPVMIVCVIAIPLFLISWQSIVRYQNNIIKESISQELISGEAYLNAFLSNRVYAFIRLFDRGTYDNYYKNDFWKKDADAYFSTYLALQSVSAQDNDGKIYLYARDADAQLAAKKNIAICNALLQQKNKNFNTTIKNVTITTNSQLFCLEKNPGNSLAIFNVQQLFSFLFDFPVWKSYGIELSNQDGIVFSKKITSGDDFFRKQWGQENKFAVFGQQWNLEIWPNEKWVREKSSLFPEFFLLFGLILTGLLATVMQMWQLSERKNKLLIQYNAIINKMDEGFCIVEIIYDKNKNPIDWRYLNVNPSFEKQTRLKNVIGKRVLEVIPTIENVWIETFAKVALSGEGVQLENFAEGLNRWYEAYAFTIKDFKKNQVAILFKDITDRKKNESDLAQQAKNIKLLYETMMIASNAKSTQDAMRDCLNLICKAIDWPVGHIYILNQNKISELESSHIWYCEYPEKMTEFKTVSEKMHFTKGVGLPGRILESKKPVWIFDINKDNNFPRAALCRDIKIRGAAGFPILLHYEVIAVFEFFSYEQKEYDERILHIFEVMGEQIGHVFERTFAHQELESHATVLQNENETLEKFAYHDHLTKIPNRLSFDELLMKTLAHAKRHKKMFALMMLDLDYFKKINDTFGHAAGDELLKQVSLRFQSVIRAEDTLARLGGDEFGILVVDIKNKEDAVIFAKKLMKALVEPIFLDEKPVNITCSVGIAVYPFSGDTAATLMQNADTAMYKVKNAGRNNFQFYEE